MWCYESDGEKLCYPFLLNPIILQGADGKSRQTPFQDISGIYGYSGPLSTTSEASFLQEAWRIFDQWAARHNVTSEFIRFSTYAGNHDWAHPDVAVEYNRPVAIALLPDHADTFMAELAGKTRNMIRKALKSGLVAKQVDVKSGLGDFRRLYEQTMDRNRATDFFMYDDAYYECLLDLPPDELLLSMVYRDGDVVAAAMGLVHADMAFYHLGASTLEASRGGAGNLALYQMACDLIERGVGYFSVGGGRTTAEDDALFRFKRSNATSTGEFYIGKRVIDRQGYDTVVNQWETMNHTRMTSGNLQFYR